MPTDLTHAREVVAGMTPGKWCRYTGWEFVQASEITVCSEPVDGDEDGEGLRNWPKNAAGIVLGVAILRALADPATVAKLADVIAEAYDAGRREERWEPANGIDAGECAALAALTFILDQAGRDAT